MSARTDATLQALLADPSPEARLIAADALSDAGYEIQSLGVRIAALAGGGYGACLIGTAFADHKAVGAVRVEVRNGTVRMECQGYRSRWHGMEYTWCPALSIDGSFARCSRRRYMTRRPIEARRCTPPPSLEAAVLAVLRRRLEALTDA